MDCPPGPNGGGGGAGMFGDAGEASSRPAYVRGTGAEASVECPALSARCPADGSGNFVERELAYDAVTGTMKGHVVSNNCPDHAIGARRPAPDCQRQMIPDPSFASQSGPAGAPLLGRVALALSSGVNVYGPFEAGFTDGQICDGGSCEGGVDVLMCERKMALECGMSPSDVGIIDECGGHATPYHYHEDMVCQPGYDKGDAGEHSPALAVALDGRLVYGRNEGNGKLASGQLDACNGHFGPVPADPENGVPAGTCTYHYHTTGEAPFTLGCFGPVSSVEHCQSLYEGCGAGFDNFTVWTADGRGEEVVYDSWCPCYQQAEDTGVCMSLGTGFGGSDTQGLEEVPEENEQQPAPPEADEGGRAGKSVLGSDSHASGKSELAVMASSDDDVDSGARLGKGVLPAAAAAAVLAAAAAMLFHRRQKSLNFGSHQGKGSDGGAELQNVQLE